MKKLSEQCPLKLKQNSVIEASNSEVEASWRGAEAVEVSLTLHIGSNHTLFWGGQEGTDPPPGDRCLGLVPPPETH